jgi:hypothetical protein
MRAFVVQVNERLRSWDAAMGRGRGRGPVPGMGPGRGWGPGPGRGMASRLGEQNGMPDRNAPGAAVRDRGMDAAPGPSPGGGYRNGPGGHSEPISYPRQGISQVTCLFIHVRHTCLIMLCHGGWHKRLSRHSVDH